MLQQDGQTYNQRESSIKFAPTSSISSCEQSNISSDLIVDNSLLNSDSYTSELSSKNDMNDSQSSKNLNTDMHSPLNVFSEKILAKKSSLINAINTSETQDNPTQIAENSNQEPNVITCNKKFNDGETKSIPFLKFKEKKQMIYFPNRHILNFNNSNRNLSIDRSSQYLFFEQNRKNSFYSTINSVGKKNKRFGYDKVKIKNSSCLLPPNDTLPPKKTNVDTINIGTSVNDKSIKNNLGILAEIFSLFSKKKKSVESLGDKSSTAEIQQNLENEVKGENVSSVGILEESPVIHNDKESLDRYIPQSDRDELFYDDYHTCKCTDQKGNYIEKKEATLLFQFKKLKEFEVNQDDCPSVTFDPNLCESLCVSIFQLYGADSAIKFIEDVSNGELNYTYLPTNVVNKLNDIETNGNIQDDNNFFDDHVRMNKISSPSYNHSESDKFGIHNQDNSNSNDILNEESHRDVDMLDINVAQNSEININDSITRKIENNKTPDDIREKDEDLSIKIMQNDGESNSMHNSGIEFNSIGSDGLLECYQNDLSPLLFADYKKFKNLNLYDSKMLNADVINKYYCNLNKFLGHLYYEKRDIYRAIYFYWRFIESNPKHSQMFKNLGLSYYEINCRKLSIEALERSIILDSTNDATVFNLLAILIIEEFAENEENDQINGRAEIHPANPMLLSSNNHSGHKIIERIREGTNRSVELLKKYLHFYPMDLSAKQDLAQIHFYREEWHESEIIFEELLQIEKNNYNFFNILGKIYFNQGKFDQAYKMYKDALDINSKNPISHMYLCELFCQQDRFDESLKEFRMCALTDIDNLELHAACGVFLCDKGKGEQLIKIYTDLLRDHPHSKATATFGNTLNVFHDESEARRIVRYVVMPIIVLIIVLILYSTLSESDLKSNLSHKKQLQEDL